ncbi:MAG: hypothetical protein AB7L09_01645 [Nitrospira sp.]
MALLNSDSYLYQDLLFRALKALEGLPEHNVPAHRFNMERKIQYEGETLLIRTKRRGDVFVYLYPDDSPHVAHAVLVNTIMEHYVVEERAPRAMDILDRALVLDALASI